MASAIVSASTGVISTLLPKLSMLIQDEYKLSKAVKVKIAFLKDELSSMQTLLVKLANNEEKLDEQLKDWKNKVRELSYDIEDCIDLFMHKMSKDDAEATNLITKTISRIKKIWSHHKMAALIDELKARVEEEGHRRKRYKFDDGIARQVLQIDPRLPALYVEAERLVGIDGPREEIIEWLKNDPYGQLKVVSIVGFGGLGKTTLANQVYQKIKGQFNCSCFVPVSRKPNIAKILANMLKELGSCVDPTDDERQLIDKLRAFLQDKRYFIIVDDIWSPQAWELFKSALPENNLNSRIITTTRITNVATSCGSSLGGYVHSIQPLGEKQSQQLFFKRVFCDASTCPPHLEEISHGILEKCQGLPLAIITIASLLAGKPTMEQWEQVYNSIGSAISHQGMREILLFSYYDLPHHLKTCLLYLSMYPEDCMIEREELTWRWIAEGFVMEVRGQTVDQVAENYFNELVNRSLIQAIDIQYDGRAKACRVHDMVLELIVSLSVEENFVSIVEGQSYSDGGNKIRRLSVQDEHGGDAVMQDIIEKWSQQVRSMSFYAMHDHEIPCLKELNSLRVLDLYGVNLGNQHIKNIGGFFHLTFLSIGGPLITELPEDIGDLRYLQTLDIRYSSIKILTPSIGRLQKLVRLLVDDLVELPSEVGDLEALQELSFGVVCSIKVVEALRRLVNLKFLGINLYGDDSAKRLYKEALESSLAVMGENGLQTLEIGTNFFLTEELTSIICCTVPCLRKLVVCGFGIPRIPKQTASLVNLTSLSMYVDKINQEDLYVLGSISALLFSHLATKHAPDERLTISSQQFRCLKEFEFRNHDYGGGLEMLFLQDSMPELRKLDLEFTAHETECMMGFEVSFQHLARLEHIAVRIFRGRATRSRVKYVEAAIRNAVSNHPGRPTLDLKFEPAALHDEENDQQLQDPMLVQEQQQMALADGAFHMDVPTLPANIAPMIDEEIPLEQLIDFEDDLNLPDNLDEHIQILPPELPEGDDANDVNANLNVGMVVLRNEVGFERAHDDWVRRKNAEAASWVRFFTPGTFPWAKDFLISKAVELLEGIFGFIEFSVPKSCPVNDSVDSSSAPKEKNKKTIVIEELSEDVGQENFWSPDSISAKRKYSKRKAPLVETEFCGMRPEDPGADALKTTKKKKTGLVARTRKNQDNRTGATSLASGDKSKKKGPEVQEKPEDPQDGDQAEAP